jgi:predicted TIM-barrel enzyme
MVFDFLGDRPRVIIAMAHIGALLKTVRDAVPDVVVLANTGVTIDNVRDILAIADGMVIGTHFKVDGNTWIPVDRGRVKPFVDAVAKLR